MKEDIETLKRKLTQKEKKLEIILAIDRIRDGTTDMQELLSSIAEIVTSYLDADLCLMSLLGEESGELELKMVDDREGIFGQLSRDALRKAAEQSTAVGQVSILDDTFGLHQQGVNHILAAPLVIGGERLGSLILFNKQRAFDQDDLDLFLAYPCLQTQLRHRQPLLPGQRGLDPPQALGLVRSQRVGDIALDVGHGKSGEPGAPCRVKAGDGFDQAFGSRAIELPGRNAIPFLITLGLAQDQADVVHEHLPSRQLVPQFDSLHQPVGLLFREQGKGLDDLVEVAHRQPFRPLLQGLQGLRRKTGHHGSLLNGTALVDQVQGAFHCHFTLWSFSAHIHR